MRLYRFGMGDEWCGQSAYFVCAETEEDARHAINEFVKRERAEYIETMHDAWPDGFSVIEAFEPGEVYQESVDK